MQPNDASEAALGRTSSADEPLLLDMSQRDPSINLGPEGSTVFQTVLSILNIVMGIGILSMPYCMSLSGIAGLGTVALCCFLFCTSGKCIAWSMEALPTGKPRSYPQLGQEALSTAGRRLVSLFAVLDLLGGSCIMMIVLWQSVMILLPEHLPYAATFRFAIIGGVLLELPLCALGSFKVLSAFSFAGCSSTIAVVLLVVALPFLDGERSWAPGNPDYQWIAPGIVPATGIVALSLAGHSTYPSVRASMAEPHRFSEALNWAYLTMAAVLSTMAAVGYWYWGGFAHTLVTRDFDLHSPYMHLVLGRGLGVHKVVEALIIVSLITRVPMLLLALQDLCHSLLAAEGRSGGHPPVDASQMSPVRGGASALVRCGMLLGVAGIAYTARNVLGIAESIVGAICAIQCSLMLPTVFYMALMAKQKRLKWPRAIGLSFLLLFGAALLCWILCQAVWDAIRTGKPAHASQGPL